MFLKKLPCLWDCTNICILQEGMMIRVQDISFHLSDGDVIFSHLVELSIDNYVGEITESFSKNSIPMTKVYTRLGSSAKNTSCEAFSDVCNAIDQICKNLGLNILEVNNPCNCELVDSINQTTILGEEIIIKVNDSI
ncbi:MAG: hypothetical protein V7749_16555 [Cocleimonas sp.]